MPTLIDRLKTIQLKIGNVGVDQLYNEAKKQKVEGISREALKLFLSTHESKQLFKPLPESKGKTASEGQQFRVQMDLIDLKYSPSRFRGKGPQFRYILVVIDVMSRFVWTAPLINKEPATVEPILRRLINSMDKKPVFVFTDKGNEFTNEVSTMLEEKEIIHKTRREAHDMNVLGVIDRAIQTIKKRLAENLADNKSEWVQRLNVITKQYNDTAHTTLHGTEPSKFGKEGQELSEFQTLADNADKLQHNTRLLERRKKKLADPGGFRTPIGAPKDFNRGFKQQWGSTVHVIKSIHGSVVTAEDGTKSDVKRALPTHSASDYAEAGFALGDQRISDKKDKLIPLMALLYAWVGSGESKSVSSAATHLRKDMGDTYKATLKKVGFKQLVSAIRLFDNEFLVETGGYYFKRV